MITITLRRIMDSKPCYDPIEKGILPNDWDINAPINFRRLAERITPEDVVWCFTNLPDEHNALKRHFAVDCAERVKHLMTDELSLNALAVARKYTLGEASDIELKAAKDAASSARAAAWDAVGAARAATWAAASSARAATWVAASSARAAAWDAAWAAASSARAAAWGAVWDAELQWQVHRIIELTESGEWSPVGEK